MAKAIELQRNTPDSFFMLLDDFGIYRRHEEYLEVRGEIR